MALNQHLERQSSFKERVKQEREHEILRAAREVFAERGFEKASIDDIAERVGIGKGTVYLHFSSKEELLLALMRQACQQTLVKCRLDVAKEAGAAAKMRRIIQAIVDHRYSNESLVNVVANELPAFIGHKQKLGASSELRAFIAGVLAEGQAEGVFDPRIRPEVAASTLLYVLYAASQAYTKRPSKHELVESANQLYFHGITKEAGK